MVKKAMLVANGNSERVSGAEARAPKTWLRALRPIFIGVAVFAVLCAILGRMIAKHEKFDNFQHFVTYIQPQTQYYPTLSELVRTTRALAPKSKILVLVGGNSIFRGTGQNVDELWSKTLQADLGDAYAVVNLAIDQGGMESFASTAFLALKRYYPRIVFLGTLDPRGFDKIDGLDIYKYIYWDGYYKGLLRSDSQENAAAARLRLDEIRTLSGFKMHAFAFLDSILYFSSVRNFIAYRIISPDWTTQIGWPFMRRDWYTEGIDPNLKALQEQIRNDKERQELMSARNEGFVRGMADLSKDPPDLRDNVRNTVRASYDSFFPRADRDRVIGVLIAANPHYFDTLPSEIWRGYVAILKRTLDLFLSQGYRGIIAGLEYQPTDFIDQGHLVASGGVKLAGQVAEEVRRVAEERGYQPRSEALR